MNWDALDYQKGAKMPDLSLKNTEFIKFSLKLRKRYINQLQVEAVLNR
jgi:hypothetical protein